MNIILIVSDTLRRDHVPGYDGPHVIAPNLTRFAKKAQVFEEAYLASFPTVSARADLMTGRYTFTYLEWGPLPQSEQTLAQTMREAGYTTMAVVDTPFLLRNGYGYDRGFHDVIWVRGQRDGNEHADVMSQRRSELDYFAPQTFHQASQWLERHHSEKFFLYIDTWDPHEPWDPPDYYVTPYMPDYAGEQVEPCYWDWREDGYSERDLEIARACYRGEISMVDRWFGRLLDQLDTLNLTDDTAIIVLSDHGYYFGEHGLFGKSRFRWPGNVPFMEGCRLRLKGGVTYRSPLHNEVTRIPLLMHIPGMSGARINGLASLADVMPTILDLADAPLPERVQAPSLLPLIRGQKSSVHDFVVSSYPLERKGTTVRRVDDREREVVEISPSTMSNGEWDFLYGGSNEPLDLYNARTDQGHQHNIIDNHSDIAQALHKEFISWLTHMDTPEQFLASRRAFRD